LVLAWNVMASQKGYSHAGFLLSLLAGLLVEMYVH